MVVPMAPNGMLPAYSMMGAMPPQGSRLPVMPMRRGGPPQMGHRMTPMPGAMGMMGRVQGCILGKWRRCSSNTWRMSFRRKIRNERYMKPINQSILTKKFIIRSSAIRPIYNFDPRQDSSMIGLHLQKKIRHSIFKRVEPCRKICTCRFSQQRLRNRIGP